MNDDLKSTLRQELEKEIGQSPRMDIAEVLQRGRRKRLFARAGMSALALVLSFGSAALIFNLGGGLDRVTNPEGENQQVGVTRSDCLSSEGDRLDLGYTSPVVLVGGGETAGNRWVLCARTVESGRSKTLGDEGLCIDWLFGAARGGWLCEFLYTNGGKSVPLDREYFTQVGGPEWGYFYGAVPADAASVKLEIDSGEAVAGTIYPAPKGLGVPFQFFTVFAKPLDEGTLIVEDESGNVIRRREMKHGLSSLTVSKDGSGEGDVLGYRTDELALYEQCQESGTGDCREPRATWIECGSDCSAALADAHITLVARPGTDSTFTGWSGACTGNGDCGLTVSQSLEVTATFEQAP